MLFKKHDKSSPLNFTHYAVLYPQNDDRIVAIDSVTSLIHPVYIPGSRPIKFLLSHAKRHGSWPPWRYEHDAFFRLTQTRTRKL